MMRRPPGRMGNEKALRIASEGFLERAIIRLYLAWSFTCPHVEELAGGTAGLDMPPDSFATPLDTVMVNGVTPV